jgi:hypothetical protein
MITTINSMHAKEQTEIDRLRIATLVRAALQEYALQMNDEIWKYRNYYHHRDWTNTRNSRRTEQKLPPLTIEEFDKLDKEARQAKRETKSRKRKQPLEDTSNKKRRTTQVPIANLTSWKPPLPSTHHIDVYNQTHQQEPRLSILQTKLKCSTSKTKLKYEPIEPNNLTIDNINSFQQPPKKKKMKAQIIITTKKKKAAKPQEPQKTPDPIIIQNVTRKRKRIVKVIIPIKRRSIVKEPPRTPHPQNPSSQNTQPTTQDTTSSIPTSNSLGPMIPSRVGGGPQVSQPLLTRPLEYPLSGEGKVTGLSSIREGVNLVK